MHVMQSKLKKQTPFLVNGCAPVLNPPLDTLLYVYHLF